MACVKVNGAVNESFEESMKSPLLFTICDTVVRGVKVDLMLNRTVETEYNVFVDDL